jgi:hypothetical protein
MKRKFGKKVDSRPWTTRADTGAPHVRSRISDRPPGDAATRINSRCRSAARLTAPAASVPADTARVVARGRVRATPADRLKTAAGNQEIDSGWVQ